MKNFIALLFCALFVYGCNPVNRLQKKNEQYNKIINDYLLVNPPRVDSSIEYLPGGTDTIFITVRELDAARFDRLKDSLQKAMYSKLKDCSREISESFETGKAQALYEVRQQKTTKQRPDTILKKMYRIGYENALIKQAASLKDVIQQQEIEIVKKQQSILNLTLWLIAATALLLTSILLYIQKK